MHPLFRGGDNRENLAMAVTERAEIIRTEHITKKFGELIAVNGVDYALTENEIAGIIGSNGAGKTTLFNLITGYYTPDEGTILFKGEDISRWSPQKRVAAGMMKTFQITSTFDNLTVLDNLMLSSFRRHQKASFLNLFLAGRVKNCTDEEILESLETFDLIDAAYREVRHLSLGEKRRLEIAMVLLGEPRVLLLDEPLAGLSEGEIDRLLGVLRRQIGKQTILIVEHKISKIEDLVERLTVMHDGRVIADGDCRECLECAEVRRSYWQIDCTS
jgi:branched-chain amino acid transport system ATP-binding protein